MDNNATVNAQNFCHAQRLTQYIVTALNASPSQKCKRPNASMIRPKDKTGDS